MKKIIIPLVIVIVLAGLVVGGWYVKNNTNWLDFLFNQQAEQRGDETGITHDFNFLIEDEVAQDELEFFVNNIKKRITNFGISDNQVEINENKFLAVTLAVPAEEEFSQDDFISVLVNTPIFMLKKQNDPALVFLSDEEKAQLVQVNEAAKIKIQGILQQALDEPDSFADLAREHSEDLGSQANGGAYTGVAKGQFVLEYEDVIFNKIEVNEVYSELVETQFGWHIIKKDAETGEGDERLIDTSHILIRKRTENEALAAKEWLDTQVTGIYIEKAEVVANGETFAVQVSLNEKGTEFFSQLTKDNIDKQVAVILNGQLLGEPVVEQEITTGQILLGGDYNQEDAQLLLGLLNNGVVNSRIGLVQE